MRESTTNRLRCPSCHADGSFELSASERDEREVRRGWLRCAHCSARFEIAHGIVELLVDPPDFVRREAAGLERFAALMRADGWDRERVLALPDVELPYWHGQARAMRELLARVAFAPGERLLDVGSNTCWASNAFARRGLEVVALDIADVELQGLRTADYFLSGGEVFFERVRSVMFDAALASASMDYVFCCEVLHHNDREHLRRTMRELYRVLRRGGRLSVVNEPLRFPLNLKRDHGREVAEFEGNEHVYFLHEYALAARRAGFQVSVPALGLAGHRGRGAPRTLRRLAGAYWRHLLAGDTPLTMDCVKR